MERYISKRLEKLRELLKKPANFFEKQKGHVSIVVPEENAALCRFVSNNPGLVSILVGYYDTMSKEPNPYNVNSVQLPDREATVKKIHGLCQRVPGSTTWNAAEMMYDEIAEGLKIKGK